MIRTIFGVVFRVLFALAAVLGVLAFLWYLEDSRNDYVEIYNDNDGYGDD